jgi:hypothetical protein
MSGTQRAVGAVVALLAVAGIAVVTLLAAGAPIGLRPEASASPEPSPAVSASPAPSVSAPPAVPDDADVLATLAEIEEQVIAIRGLPAADIGPAELITRDELGDELQRLFDEQYPPEERERDNLALRALGLLDADEDVAELQLQLLGDQVLGFYDDIEKRMVVVTDAGLDPAAKLTYAHEYTHALQDAAFGLDSLETDAVGEDDRGLARTAMIEGDATVTMLAWAFEHLTQQELLDIGTTTEIPDTTGIPSWMVNQLQFPYTAGQLWAGALTVNPLSPDFDELDAAYADPPDTTEQIIDLDAWYDREGPVPVEVVDLVELLGEGWTEVDATPIGQASIDIVLQHFGVTVPLAGAAAKGWGGDRAVIASGPDGDFAVAWRLAWDSATDAEEFADAYATVADALPFPAVVRAIGDDDVLVVHASDDDLLKQVADAAD